MAQRGTMNNLKSQVTRSGHSSVHCAAQSIPCHDCGLPQTSLAGGHGQYTPFSPSVICDSYHGRRRGRDHAN